MENLVEWLKKDVSERMLYEKKLLEEIEKQAESGKNPELVQRVDIIHAVIEERREIARKMLMYGDPVDKVAEITMLPKIDVETIHKNVKSRRG